jgi:hypothetical protein
MLEFMPHGGVTRQAWEVRWFAPLRKSMDDLMAWVETGAAPPPGTGFKLSELNQVELAPTAAARHGYQPVVSLSASGKTGRFEVEANQPVQFRAIAEDPDNEIVRLEIDYDGDGKFEEKKDCAGRRQTAELSHTYAKPGTFFATVRVTDSTASAGPNPEGIQNLGHVRIVVR